MIDIKLLRENPELVKKSIINKGIKNFDFDKLLGLDKDRLSVLKEVEELRNKRNSISFITNKNIRFIFFLEIFYIWPFI